MSLAHSAANGAKWSTVSVATSTAILVLQTTALARLLSPEDFGLVAMLLVVVAFAQSYVDAGFSNALIQRQHATAEELSSMYWTTILIGWIAAGLLVLLAPAIAALYREQRVEGLVLVVSLSFVILPFGQQFQAILQRDLCFRQLACVDVASVSIGTAIALLTAHAGAGAYALAWGQVTNAATRTVLLSGLGLKRWRPSLHWRPRDLTAFLSFGLFQMGERSINQIGARLDHLIIGRALGAEALGFYTIAYQLVIMPLLKINPVLTRVAFPIFARKQHDTQAVTRGWHFVIKSLALVVLPLLTGIALVADMTVPLILGDGWEPVALLITILAPVGAFKSLTNPAGSVLLARGRADVGFYWNAAVLVVNGLAFMLAVQFGVEAIAMSYAVLSCVYFIALNSLVCALLRQPAFSYFRALKAPSAATLIMAACTVAALASFKLTAIEGVPVFAILLLVGSLAYVWSTLRLDRLFINEAAALFSTTLKAR